MGVEHGAGPEVPPLSALSTTASAALRLDL